ncbi:MAG TPA: hypothetical protein VEK33_21330 [Terriglobales bacterium]|nr:hypothetical protein [Terriglobales bacterium]
MPILVRVSRPAFWLLLIAGIACASDWQAPASQLAQRIAGITGPGAIGVSVLNRSSLSPSDADDVRRKLLSELAAYGVQSTTSDQAAATVQISLSENLQSYIWVAEIHQGASEPVIVTVAVPGSLKGSGDRSASPLTIRKSLLWSDENRILDVAVIDGNPAHMIVLEGESVALYRSQNAQWQPEQILPVVHVHPWPRDLRGRLLLRKDHLFDAYLPGVYCRSTPTAPLSMSCDDSDDPWPLTENAGELNAFFSASRNFFTGAISPGIQKQTMVPAFYSAAPLPRDRYTLWAFAAVDGQVHFLDGVGQQDFSQLGWGSDLASVHSGCGPGWQILTTSNESGSTDEVRAFELADRQPNPVSAPAQFNGGITALWSNSGSTGVTAIARNGETGQYEVYRLTIDCHQ